MSEEKDEATLAMERADQARDGGQAAAGLPALVPQLVPSPGMPKRLAVQRRTTRVLGMLHNLPAAAQQAIMDSLPADDLTRARAGDPALPDEQEGPGEPERPTGPGEAEGQEAADRRENLTDRLLGRRRHSRAQERRGGGA